MIVLLWPTTDQSDQEISHDIHVLPDTISRDDMQDYFNRYGNRVDHIFDTSFI